MRTPTGKRGMLFLWILSLVILLSGCGGQERLPDAEGPLVDGLLRTSPPSAVNQNMKTLRMWSFHTAREYEFMKSLAEQYHVLYPDVEIKLENIPADEYFSGNKLISAFASGEGPDIFFVSSGTIKKFADAQILQPLTDEFTPEIKADFNPSSLEAVTINNEIYAVPFEIEILGLFYNKRMFEQKGIQPPRTWEDMRDAAEKLVTDKISGLTVETYGSIYQNFSWLPFFWQTGVDFFPKDQTGKVTTDPGMNQIFSYFRTMRDQGLLNLHPSRPTTDIGILGNGETAMQISGSWNIPAVEKTYADVPIGVVPLPVPSTGKPATIAGGWKMAVNRHSENAKEAADFVMWAFAKDTANPLKWCSEVKFAYSPRKSVMTAGKDYYKHGLRSVFTDQIFGTERQEPQMPEEISRILTEVIQDILFSKLDEKAAVAKANKLIQDYLSAPAGK